MFGRWIVGGLAVALLIGSQVMEAQLRPLVPLPSEGLRVVPFFDGWYANPDGTITYSFGYSNLNQDKLVEIPLGPDNFITPKEYDGRQPTVFPTLGAEAEDGGGGGAAGAARGAGAAGATASAPAAGAAPAATPAAAAPDAAATPAAGAARGGAAGRGGAAAIGTGSVAIERRGNRDRGVFTITVPGTFKGDVVWTLRYAGQTWATPARSKSTAYQLSWPMAMGSTPPLMRFTQTGASNRGPHYTLGPALQAKVGTPLPMEIWITDDAVHDKPPIKFGRETPGMNVSWIKHSGPAGEVKFEPAKSPFAEMTGSSKTMATFNQPGEYVVRIKADTFGNPDSSSGNQCCWTNGYQKVTVTR